MQPPGFDGKDENDVSRRKSAGEWGGNGLVGMRPLGLGSRQKSITELIQVSFCQFFTLCADSFPNGLFKLIVVFRLVWFGFN